MPIGGMRVRKTPIPQFKAFDFFMIGDSDAVSTVLDRDCDNFDHLIGRTVQIDGVEFQCGAVECAMPRPPHKRGDAITLIISVFERAHRANGGA